MVMFDKKEWITFAIAVIIIGVALGFNDKQNTFEFFYWSINLLWTIAMVAFSFLVYQFAQKTIAKMNGFKTELKLWSIDTVHFNWWRGFMIKKKPDFPKIIRIFGREYKINSIPIGVIISLIITFVSNGWLFFLAITHYDLLVHRAKRLGRRFINVTGYDEAKIALAGPIACVFLMILFKLINFNGMFDRIIFVNSWLAIFNMIPFFQFDGGKVWNGSRVLYIFSLVFIISISLLIYFLDVIPLLFVAIIIAIITAVIYFYKVYIGFKN